MARLHPILLCIALLLCSGQVLGHNKTKTEKPPCNQSNHTGHGQEDKIDTLFMNWIQFVGDLSHSHFPVVPNLFNPVSTIIVDKNAKVGHFTSIQEAIDSVAVVNLQRVLIKINPGVYTEKLTISPLRSFITLEGSGADKTIVQWGSNAHSEIGAFASATLAINAPSFIAKNITFKNTAPNTAAGAGVAVRVSADTAAFMGCKFIGAHNTLYDHIGRHYYKDCSIEGGADFIFGQALSFFEGCFLKAATETSGLIGLDRGVSLLDNAGLSFSNCNITGAALFYLGKAWNTFAKVVFSNSFLDHIEIPKGFDPNAALKLFFGVFNCFGPGATSGVEKSWAKELTPKQAMPFTSLKFIDGHEWIKF